MNHQPFVIEKILEAPASMVWRAITDARSMKDWYFDIPDFKAQVGLKFQFAGGPEDRQYIHLCEVTEVELEKKITYSWKYQGYEGISFVTFELFPEGNKTKLRLTHAGLESFPTSNADLARENFVAGWNEIIGNLLIDYLAKQPQKSSD